MCASYWNIIKKIWWQCDVIIVSVDVNNVCANNNAIIATVTMIMAITIIIKVYNNDGSYLISVIAIIISDNSYNDDLKLWWQWQ